MVKFLVCGNLSDEAGWEILTARLRNLQESQHGPFEALFISGGLFATKEQYNHALLSSSNLCIPSYITVLPSFVAENSNLLPENLHLIGRGDSGLVTISTLTVAYLNSKNIVAESITAELDSMQVKVNAPAYRGCDLFLSDVWPKDMHHLLEEGEFQQLQSVIEPGFLGASSSMVATAATIFRPRYHFSNARFFFQRSPYRNTHVSGLSPVTRFVSLAMINTSKDKHMKWLHALSLEPIVYMATKDLVDEPEGTTDSPYVAVGKPLARPQQLSLQERVASENELKRPRFGGRGTGSGALFFGHMGMPRADTGALPIASSSQPPLNLVPPSITATTLFIGNVPRGLMDKELRDILEGCVSVRMQDGKSFAFAEFESHHAALQLVERCSRPGGSISTQGRMLSIGWASSQSRPRSDESNRAPALPREIEVISKAPSHEAKVLFLGGLPRHNADHDGPPAVTVLDLSPWMAGITSLRLVPGKQFAFAEFGTHAEAAAVMSLYAPRNAPLVLPGPAKEDGTSSYEISIGWAKDASGSRTYSPRVMNSTPPTQSSACLFIGGIPQTATDATMLSVFQVYLGGDDGHSLPTVRRPEGKNFAFIDFSSHEAAVKALMSVPPAPMINGSLVSVGWAKGISMSKNASKSDHDDSCWFCLASPQLKTHLIMSVAQHSYLALPRGSMHPLHCLITPIDCIPNKIHLSPSALSELLQYERKVSDMFIKCSFATLVFERCIRTSGKDHMQAHVIPIPTDRVSGALGIFMSATQQYNLKFREIEDEDRGVDEVVVSMEGGPYQEYFYISLPVGAHGAVSKNKRFVYVLEEEPIPADAGHGGKRYRFPMHFGNEVAAQVLGQPEKAHWKHCLVSQEEEEKLAAEFRERFAEFDFTS